MTTPFLDPVSPDDCPFCKITDAYEQAQPIPAEDFQRVHIRGYAVHSFVPLNPVVPGHRLFAPEYHEVHPGDHYLGAAMQAAQNWAKSQSPAYNLITSAGAAATQTVEHMHVHYVPRVEGDGLRLPWTAQEHGEPTPIPEFVPLLDNSIDQAYRIIDELTDLRKGRGMSRADLARYVGVSEESIRDMEALAAMPRLSTLWRVAAILGRQVEYRLVKGDEA